MGLKKVVVNKASIQNYGFINLQKGREFFEIGHIKVFGILKTDDLACFFFPECYANGFMFLVPD